MISNKIRKQASNNTDIEVSTTDPTSSYEATSKLDVMKERLRQAQLSFNVALVMSAMCGLFSLFGIALSVSGNFPDGSITAIEGLLSSVPWLRLAKDANDRLDRLNAEEK
ncbi:TRADD-N-associated membrane domain-containing protein [Nostoc sp. DSM 114167]|jgi:hypothetical protein|uniref:TRADD-N-associated membrane domain-containing protein n=1 Tax=Nostoc sp. DSM 114167 TaxID=3439050 RepID=UPI004045D186